MGREPRTLQRSSSFFAEKRSSQSLAGRKGPGFKPILVGRRIRRGESNERRREIKAIKLPLPPKAGNQGGNKAGSIVFLNPYFIGWTITIGHVTPENQKLKAILDELSE